MYYKDFYVDISKTAPSRVNADGAEVLCDGFRISIFEDDVDDTPIEVFTAAVGYELLEYSIQEAEQLAKDYIDTEKMALRKQ